ncbi:MAG: DUF1559 domain-containing protein [Mariniblastus sp.]|nr:DUF1559 domain-containing protein [Mariniblastus sp.]
MHLRSLVCHRRLYPMPFPKLLLFLLLTTSVGLLIQGCSRPTTVDAVPRPAGNAPKYHANETPRDGDPAQQAVWNGNDVAFLNSDHFACFRGDPVRLLENMRALDVNSDGLQDLLANLIGPANAKLENLENVWIILDREFFSVIPDMSGQPTISPAIVILDLATPVDKEQLEQLAQAVKLRRSERDERSDEEPTVGLETRLLSERRISIGAPAALNKLSENGSGASGLVRDLQALPPDAELTGVISIRPIRTTLQGLFDLLRNAPGDINQLVDLPSDLQKMTFNLNFNQPDNFFEMAFYIDNPELKTELFQMANTALADSAGVGSPGLSSLPVGGGLPMGAIDNGQLIETESTPLILELVEQIQRDRLLQVREEPQKLLVTMARPGRLTDALQAVMRDSQRQLEAEQRTARFRKIAAALKEYEEQHGALPSVESRSQTEDLPAQFSWRVALLPMLGYQELYDRFQFDQPWDHPENLQVAEEIPTEFQFQPDTHLSNIHLFAGPGGLHADRASAPGLDQVKDRKIWNAIVIEGSEKTALPWTQPEALNGPADSLSRFGKEGEKGVLMIDGRFDVRAVRRNLETIQSVLSVEGGETMKRADFIKLN